MTWVGQILRRRRFPWIAYAMCVVYVGYIVFPVYWIFKSSVTPLPELFRSPPDLWTADPTIQSYVRLWTTLPFLTYLTNSVIFAVGTALLSLAVSVLAAYAFARFEFRGKDLLFVLFLLSTALPPIATAIPLFELFRELGLVNTVGGLVILQASLVTPFTIWILRSFLMQLPKEIEEAAIIDGASMITVILRIVTPLAMPAIATLFVINFVLAWNELFYPLVFASAPQTEPMTVALVQLTTGASGGSFGRPWDLMSAMSIVMVLPPIVLVTVFQRFVVQGLTRGAVR